jgi:GNAT superfamily N-acetyltransferase
LSDLVSGARRPLFCDIALAARIERADVDLIAKAGQASARRTGDPAAFATAIAGGVAVFAEEGSPFNKVAGLGFSGVPSDAELNEIERAYGACSAPVQVELSNLAEPAVGATLTERGYRLASYENVLGLAITPDIEWAAPPGIDVRRIGDDELPAWLDVVVDGFAHPDDQGIAFHEEFPREVIERAESDVAAAGVVRYAALLDKVIAGGASIRIADGVAQFAGAATAPAYRRRGVQTALLAARLADASAAGCDIGVVTTQPGSRSQQNVQGRGFELLYTRAVLIKDP